MIKSIKNIYLFIMFIFPMMFGYTRIPKNTDILDIPKNDNMDSAKNGRWIILFKKYNRLRV